MKLNAKEARSKAAEKDNAPPRVRDYLCRTIVYGWGEQDQRATSHQQTRQVSYEAYEEACKKLFVPHGGTTRLSPQQWIEAQRIKHANDPVQRRANSYYGETDHTERALRVLETMP